MDKTLRRLAKVHRTDLHVVESLSRSIGSELTAEMLKMHPSEILSTARVNLLKSSRNEAIKILARENVRAIPLEAVPEGIAIVQGAAKLGHSLAYLQGMVSPQGLGSMLTVHILDPQPNEVILDMAAAPGGKTTFIAERMKNSGLLVANDINRGRIQALRANLNRHGIVNCIVVNEDATTLKLDQKFDRILIDAPCTGEGLIVSHPQRRTSREIVDPFIMQRTQQRLIKNAIRLLKEGGTLVYSTCSLNTAENEEALLPFISKWTVNPINDVKLEPKPVPSEIIPGSIRLLPPLHACDGFYIAKITKEER